MKIFNKELSILSHLKTDETPTEGATLIRFGSNSCLTNLKTDISCQDSLNFLLYYFFKFKKIIWVKPENCRYGNFSKNKLSFGSIHSSADQFSCDSCIDFLNKNKSEVSNMYHSFDAEFDICGINDLKRNKENIFLSISSDFFFCDNFDVIEFKQKFGAEIFDKIKAKSHLNTTQLEKFVLTEFSSDVSKWLISNNKINDVFKVDNNFSSEEDWTQDIKKIMKLIKKEDHLFLSGSANTPEIQYQKIKNIFSAYFLNLNEILARNLL